jgi:hypothetical protein
MQETETLSFDGPPAIWRRACTSCTNAKRKCSKELPLCRRCNQRDLQCLYPPARAFDANPPPTEGIIGSNGAFPSVSALGSQLASELRQDSESAIMTAASVPLRVLQSTQEQMHLTSAPWFLAHDSWEIAHLPPQSPPELFSEETLNSYVAMVQDWLRIWVLDDHCPFIHRYLYRVNMPRCVQDAYSTISVYLYKTPATESTVRRIVEQRLHQLMEEMAVNSALDLGFTTLVEHLARVQALLVLLVICLFDGNIRLRAQGELHLATLLVWNNRMWQQFTEEMQSDLTLEPWRQWIFGESLRRTWLTISIINSVYMHMTQGFSSCPGGVYCTFGNNLWDATSYHDWQKGCESERKRLFMQSLDVNELFLREEPDAVDTFGRAIILISLGIDKFQQWMVKRNMLADN